ncbi:hypothetical protein R5W24_004310 [Gemmata sp. JC717]|uniref:Chromosome partition protein Smc n=1 Tax=Gemmata algarum TaxID=2975278 RepID=A0ABU5F7R9_9BACT|nr:hypothetical protein [Gemmata algarum]MDY3555172.1 hypothetical protein [Gemmata algarum]MDY3563646.1 hypothetical protein [Gemmata algarum]
MSTKRGVQTDESLEQTGELAAYETTRSAADSSSDKAPPKKDEEHISVFWRVFGGTILSIVALVAVTLYNNTSSSISELRAQLSREHEARAELVKKDEFNTRTTAQYERMRAIDTIKVELEGVKEKVNTNTATVDGSKRDTNAALEAMRKEVAAHADAMKKDAAALEVLKERVVLVEGVKKDVAAMDSLKEKLATALADLKIVHDNLQKLSTDVERNKLSDLERKALRDSQHKQVDEALKELQKGLQDCREKLARLEGAQPKPGTEVPRPNSDANRAKPAAPGEVKPASGTKPPEDE